MNNTPISSFVLHLLKWTDNLGTAVTSFMVNCDSEVVGLPSCLSLRYSKFPICFQQGCQCRPFLKVSMPIKKSSRESSIFLFTFSVAVFPMV